MKSQHVIATPGHEDSRMLEEPACSNEGKPHHSAGHPSFLVCRRVWEFVPGGVSGVLVRLYSIYPIVKEKEREVTIRGSSAMVRAVAETDCSSPDRGHFPRIIDQV